MRKKICQILTNLHISFTAEKSVKFPTKQCVTFPTTPKICCYTTSIKLDVQI